MRFSTHPKDSQPGGLCLELECDLASVAQYEPSELESLVLPATEGNLPLGVLILMGDKILNYRDLRTAMREERLNSVGSVVKGAKTPYEIRTRGTTPSN